MRQNDCRINDAHNSRYTGSFNIIFCCSRNLLNLILSAFLLENWTSLKDNDNLGLVVRNSCWSCCANNYHRGSPGPDLCPCTAAWLAAWNNAESPSDTQSDSRWVQCAGWQQGPVFLFPCIKRRLDSTKQHPCSPTSSNCMQLHSDPLTCPLDVEPYSTYMAIRAVGHFRLLGSFRVQMFLKDSYVVTVFIISFKQLRFIEHLLTADGKGPTELEKEWKTSFQTSCFPWRKEIKSKPRWLDLNFQDVTLC